VVFAASHRIGIWLAAIAIIGQPDSELFILLATQARKCENPGQLVASWGLSIDFFGSK
jgi:hypothetical protein